MLTGKYRKGEDSRAEGFGGKVFQPENSAQRTQVLNAAIDCTQGCCLGSAIILHLRTPSQQRSVAVEPYTKRGSMPD